MALPIAFSRTRYICLVSAVALALLGSLVWTNVYRDRSISKADEQNPPPPPAHLIIGTVTFADGTPAANIHITIGNQSTVTTSDGSYRLITYKTGILPVRFVDETSGSEYEQADTFEQTAIIADRVDEPFEDSEFFPADPDEIIPTEPTILPTPTSTENLDLETMPVVVQNFTIVAVATDTITPTPSPSPTPEP